MRSEPVWVTAQDLVILNREIVAATGEPHFVRDGGLVEMATLRPYNRWAYDGEDDIAALAVAALVGVGRLHPFGQGNKRKAFAAFGATLNLNGLDFAAPDDEALADLIVGSLVDDVRGEPRLLETMRPFIQPIR